MNLIENLYKTIDKLTYRLIDKEKYIRFLKDLLEENNVEYKKAFKENKWKYELNQRNQINKTISKNFILKRVNSKYFQIKDIQQKYESEEQDIKNKQEEECQQLSDVCSKENSGSKQMDDDQINISDRILNIINQINQNIDSSLSINKNHLLLSAKQNQKQGLNQQNQQNKNINKESKVNKEQTNNIVKEDLRIINNTMSLNKRKNFENDENKPNKIINNESKVSSEETNNIVKEDLRIINNTMFLNKGKNYRKNKKKRQKIRSTKLNLNKTESLQCNDVNVQNKQNHHPQIINEFQLESNVNVLNNVNAFQYVPGFENQKQEQHLSKNQENQRLEEIDTTSNNDLFKNIQEVHGVNIINDKILSKQQDNMSFHDSVSPSNLNQKQINIIQELDKYNQMVKIGKDVVTLNCQKEKGANLECNKNNNNQSIKQNENKKCEQNNEMLQSKINQANENNEPIKMELSLKTVQEINRELYESRNRYEQEQQEAYNNYIKMVEQMNNSTSAQVIKEKDEKELEEICTDSVPQITSQLGNIKENRLNKYQNINSEHSKHIQCQKQNEVYKQNDSKNKDEENSENKRNSEKIKGKDEGEKNKHNKNKNNRSSKGSKDKNNEQNKDIKNQEQNSDEQNDNQSIYKDEEILEEEELIKRQEILIQAENNRLENIYNQQISELVNGKKELTKEQQNKIMEFQKEVDKLNVKESELNIKKAELNKRRAQNKHTNVLSDTQVQPLFNKIISSVLSPFISIKNFILIVILIILGIVKILLINILFDLIILIVYDLPKFIVCSIYHRFKQIFNKRRISNDKLMSMIECENITESELNEMLNNEGADNGGGNTLSEKENEEDFENTSETKVIVKKKNKKRIKNKKH